MQSVRIFLFCSPFSSQEKGPGARVKLSEHAQRIPPLRGARGVSLGSMNKLKSVLNNIVRTYDEF